VIFDITIAIALGEPAPDDDVNIVEMTTVIYNIT
jgi:hypothetical protein